MLGVEANGDALGPILAERYGCRLVAITQRDLLARANRRGARRFDGSTRAVGRSKRHVVEVVDRVGGGDSFAAG
jgi:sugar/nucleoside kinase (ribokinase family)